MSPFDLMIPIVRKIGLVLVIVSLSVLTPLMLILPAIFREPFEKYDHKAIGEKGHSSQAVIRHIYTRDNISHNGNHPVVIVYAYDDNGVTVEDRFQTIGIIQLEKGDTVTVSVLDDRSVIKGISPYKFSIALFWTLPIIMFTVGVLLMATSRQKNKHNYNIS